MQPPDRVRLDKWLWAVRLYKSRSLATEACNAGHVKIDGLRAKASHSLRVGETITALAGRIHRTVKVLALLEQRVAGKLVSHHLEDLTPPAEYERAKQEAAASVLQYPKGWGRPTKKQRRLMEQFTEPELRS